MALTPKKTLFAAEYLVDKNATQAAIRAGYSKRTANSQGPRLLVDVDVAALIAASVSRQINAAELTAQMVLDRLRVLAFQDVRQLFDEAGNLKPLKDLSDEAAACIAGFEIIKKNAIAGDGVIDTVHKVKAVDGVKALEMLAKHFGLLMDKVEHSGDLTIRWLSEE